jgi:pantoate--beta-alanine ligase
LLGKSIGFVPTMGALHQGHISLISQSLTKTDVTVCSIFVNPTQFNNSSDLKNYPKTIESDLKLLTEVSCDVLFLPDENEMYPNGFEKITEYFGTITDVLEGEKRPGHFAGVVTIVSLLFDIVEPNKVFFGQKDYQQCLVVAELIRRHFSDIELFIEPTLRENSGLAMSSRNARLSETEKIDALNISKALFFIQENWTSDSVENLISEAERIVEEKASLKLEYLKVCDRHSLKYLSGHSSEFSEAVVLIAAFCGEIRLIDNLIIKYEKQSS